MLREKVRRLAGRDRNPSAALTDSQTVRGAEIVPRTSCGLDAGNRPQRPQTARRRG